MGGLGWIRPAMGGGGGGVWGVLVEAAHGGPRKQLRTHRRQRGFPKLLIDTTLDVFSHSRFFTHFTSTFRLHTAGMDPT